MQEENKQQGSGRSADLRRLYEALFRSQKTSNDDNYGDYDDVNDDDDADCYMD